MRVYIGIDWSEAKHDLTFLNEHGQQLMYFTVAHTEVGLMEIERARQKLQVPVEECVIGLETAHNLLIDFLWEWGYEQVYVLPPQAVKKARTLYRQSNAHDDQSDSWLIANLLRHDLPQFHRWSPDSALTRQLRVEIGLVLEFAQDIRRLSNRLRANLLRYYPAAVHVFASLDSPLAQAFLQAYPTPQAAARLSFSQFSQFCRQHRYPQPKKLPACFARLQASYPQPHPDTVQAFEQATLTLVDLLSNLVQQRKQTMQHIQQLYQQHPDYPIFHSLPGAGDLLEPALLVKFGDDRSRFPQPAALQALAGTCPVTDKSGKRKHVYFRRACDPDFRYIAQQWARLSISSSAWAAAYYQQVRVHCHSESHAYRCLANRWLAVAWKLWQSHTPYDDDFHLRQRLERGKPKTHFEHHPR